MEAIPEHGRLDEIPLPRLLLGLQREQFGGAVTLSRERVGKRFLFREGLPIFAESNLASESLGVQLMDAGRITRADYNRLIAHVERETCKEGKALLDLGLLDAKGLFLALKEQVRIRLLECFGWPHGEFFVDPGSEPPADAQPFRAEIFSLLQEGIETHWSSERVLADLHARMELFPELSARSERIAAQAAQRRRRGDAARGAGRHAQPLEGGPGREDVRAAWRRSGCSMPPERSPTATPPSRTRTPASADGAADRDRDDGRARGLSRPAPSAAVSRQPRADRGGGAAPPPSCAARSARSTRGSPSSTTTSSSSCPRTATPPRSSAPITSPRRPITRTRWRARGWTPKRAPRRTGCSRRSARRTPRSRIPSDGARYDEERRGGGSGIDANRLANAENFYRKGEILMRQGNFRGAFEFLKPAVELWPDECAYQSALGWTYYKKTPSEPEAGAPASGAGARARRRRRRHPVPTRCGVARARTDAKRGRPRMSAPPVWAEAKAEPALRPSARASAADPAAVPPARRRRRAARRRRPRPPRPGTGSVPRDRPSGRSAPPARPSAPAPAGDRRAASGRGGSAGSPAPRRPTARCRARAAPGRESASPASRRRPARRSASTWYRIALVARPHVALEAQRVAELVQRDARQIGGAQRGAAPDRIGRLAHAGGSRRRPAAPRGGRRASPPRGSSAQSATVVAPRIAPALPPARPRCAARFRVPAGAPRAKRTPSPAASQARERRLQRVRLLGRRVRRQRDRDRIPASPSGTGRARARPAPAADTASRRPGDASRARAGGARAPRAASDPRPAAHRPRAAPRQRRAAACA